MWKSLLYRFVIEVSGFLFLIVFSLAIFVSRFGGSCRSCVVVCEYFSGGGGWERMAWVVVVCVCLKLWKCLRGSFGYLGFLMIGIGVVVFYTYVCF